jgi:hypothetical protein
MTIRQSLFGVFFGAIPGIGSGVIDWMSYALGIAFTKDKSQFGHGSLDGVLFAESAQNAKEGGQAIPTLALGIPGGRAWAFVMLGMLAYGIAPGPRMLEQHADITIMIVLSLGLGNLAVTMLGLGFTRQMAMLTKIPYPVLGFLIIPISFLAAYQQTGDNSALAIVLGGAVLGLLMKRYKWPRPPLLIGFILGPIIENNVINSVGRYDWVGTFTRPLFLILFVSAIATAVLFTKFMDFSGPGTTTETGTDAEATPVPPAGAAPDAPGGFLTRRMEGLTWRFSENQLFSGLMMLMMAYGIYESSSYSFFGRWFPMGLSIIAFVLATVTFVKEGFGAKTGEIMDIGIRSAGMEGARAAGLMFIGLLSGMLLITGLFGLQWGAIAIAIAGPPVMMQNKTGYIGGAVAGFVIALLIYFFFGGIFGSDGFLAVLWPEPFILDMLEN